MNQIALLHIQSIFTFQWQSYSFFLSSIACNSTIASNKQKQEHNILGTIPGAKLKEAMSTPGASNL